MEVEAAKWVPYRRPMLTAVQLSTEVYVYSSCGEELRCNCTLSTAFTNFQYSDRVKPLEILLSGYIHSLICEKPWLPVLVRRREDSMRKELVYSFETAIPLHLAAITDITTGTESWVGIHKHFVESWNPRIWPQNRLFSQTQPNPYSDIFLAGFGEIARSPPETSPTLQNKLWRF